MPPSERIPLSEVLDLIAVGVGLPFRVLDATGRLLLNQDQVVGSERQFEALIERGAWVERPLVEEVRRARGTARPVIEAARRQATLFDLWEKAVWDLDELTRRLLRHHADAAEIDAFADRLLALIDRDADVALFGCIRQDDRRFALYPHKHGLHSSVLAALTARQLGWAAERVSCLVKATLTMNVAMFELQGVMAEQRDPPSAKQLQAIRAHPKASADLLRAAGVSDAEWLQTVEDHHERQGGDGYPRGVQEVTEAAQVLRAADVFMAKISPRAARAAMPPQLAARQLFQQQGGAPLATALIRAVGVYPPGSLVQLKSGEVAVVSRRPKSGAAPMVATLSNAKGHPVSDTHQRDTSAPEFAVLSILADTSAYPRVLPERVYGMMLA